MVFHSGDGYRSHFLKSTKTQNGIEGERKQAEEALKDSEQRLALALDSGQMGAWDLDLIRDTAIRSLKHDQIFGYDSLLPQWGAEIFMKHVVPDDREQVQEQFQEAFTKGNLNFECRIITQDKSIRRSEKRQRQPVINGKSLAPIVISGSRSTSTSLPRQSVTSSCTGLS